MLNLEIVYKFQLKGKDDHTRLKKKSDLYKRLTWSFFPGGPVVRTLFTTEGPGSIPGQEVSILQARHAEWKKRKKRSSL